jgi:hypothetical protein
MAAITALNPTQHLPPLSASSPCQIPAAVPVCSLVFAFLLLMAGLFSTTLSVHLSSSHVLLLPFGDCAGTGAALAYARAHFGPFQQKHMRAIQRLMGALVFCRPAKPASVTAMDSDAPHPAATRSPPPAAAVDGLPSGAAAAAGDTRMTSAVQEVRASNGTTSPGARGAAHTNGVSAHNAAGSASSGQQALQGHTAVRHTNETNGDVHMADANGTGPAGAGTGSNSFHLPGAGTGTTAAQVLLPPSFTLEGTPYTELYSDQAWEECAREFIRQACSLMGTVGALTGQGGCCLVDRHCTGPIHTGGLCP